jgi:hypothetical protein
VHLAVAVLSKKVQKFAANFGAGEHGRVTIILASDISIHRRDAEIAEGIIRFHFGTVEFTLSQSAA